ncbi:MAG TPA: twin-arginine translocase TatA/TatE family subunit [Gemmatimonas aurantiaca]|uniref:Sec-independent protein translocase protein TatA n=2 Tax=Gemmatimonas aurantiaca TaxID=173480 RepID=C1A4E7_GEMAT|nr:twin-arginine translocase TatA/TatE family subunit [Gemmatimonas aurantiaca]BAH38972.1 Sec-independent protein translocase protein tatA/E [Gemmatimonas aurantiaca T-27]HCT57142.1 twin-arginine translocase TatA/TatE family subunit [Gemmatimonas aurantiaca]
MNFGNFGFGEILIILVIVLLLFGAKRIPEIAGSLGKGINEFKRNISDAQRQITEQPRTEQRIAEGQPAQQSNAADEDRPEPKRLLN